MPGLLDKCLLWVLNQSVEGSPLQYDCVNSKLEGKNDANCKT